jgi:hypothetical protein
MPSKTFVYDEMSTVPARTRHQPRRVTLPPLFVVAFAVAHALANDAAMADNCSNRANNGVDVSVERLLYDPSFGSPFRDWSDAGANRQTLVQPRWWDAFEMSDRAKEIERNLGITDAPSEPAPRKRAPGFRARRQLVI